LFLKLNTVSNLSFLKLLSYSSLLHTAVSFNECNNQRDIRERGQDLQHRT